MIAIEKHIISEAFEQLAKKKSLKESKEEYSRDMFPRLGTTFSTWLMDNHGLDIDELTDDEYKEYHKEYEDTMKIVHKMNRKDESKLTEAPEEISIKDFADKMRARKLAQKQSNPLDKIKSQITPGMPVEEKLEVYFNELVPESGKADTVAGELVRAIMRLLYRDSNDGDIFYSGYGKETCGPSVIYLLKTLPVLEERFSDIVYKQLEDDQYTDSLQFVADDIMDYLDEHPDLFVQKNNDDSRYYSGNFEEYFDLPTYEFDLDTSYDDDYYSIDDEDVDNFVRSIVEYDLSSGHVNRWASDGWSIEDLDKEDYDTLEENWERWFRQFLEEYIRDDADEEEEQEESLKEDTVKQGNKWVNKGDSGKTHGKFDTKKKADAQRRAMFANGYKAESIKNSVAEDFNEYNLDKMGTNEYEANTNRNKHIKMYRKFANLSENDPITEETINEYALNKTATYCNREPERIRAEILGQRYSEYED